MNVYLKIDKSDLETAALLRDLNALEEIKEDSFSGSDVVIFVIPLASLVLGSSVVKALVEKLIDNRRMSVEYKGMKIEGDFAQVDKTLRYILEQEQRGREQ